MTDNFFLDNQDLQHRLEQLDVQEVVDILEDGYRWHDEYPTAPRNYRDAKDNYRLMLEVLGEVCATVIAPSAPEADREGARFVDGEVIYSKATQESIQALRQAELMGAMLPWKYGGLNLPESIYQMMVELVSRAEAGLMTIFGLQEVAAMINELCDEDVKERLLPRFSRGEVGGAMILTEADAGSDLGSVQMRANYDEETDSWTLNGVKRFITNGNAEVQLVLARSEPGSGDARGLSLFVVERDESIKIRRIEHKMGINASPTCELQYNNTPAILIGKRRYGLLRYAMALMNGARLAVGAQALGIAEAAYREALTYAGERIQFGEPIMELPPVARMLLEMRAEIEASRALIAEAGRWVDLLKCYEIAQERLDETDPALRKKQRHASSMADILTPMTKYYASEMSNRVTFQALQVHGGVGYMKEFNIERHYRDARVTNIYEGTSQLQVVAALGKLLGHALDEQLDAWAAEDYGPEQEDLREDLSESNQLFKIAIDSLKEQDRPVIDYYAGDLMDTASWLVNSWLMLDDGKEDERKRKLARMYVSTHVEDIHRATKLIKAADSSAYEARELLL
jgi:alkylation response protein AidB-like acyl-CoA dehydrogenase